MGRRGFWSRLGGWFRMQGHGATFENGTPGDAPAPVPPGGGAVPATREVSRNDEPSPTPKHRLVRRDAALERLEEGYGKILGLIESIERHLEQQDDQAEAVTRSLERIADTLGNWHERARTQAELVAEINSRLEAESARTRKFQESLAQWPAIADAQRETMSAISRQIDLSRETGDRVATTMQGFGQSVVELTEAVSTSTSTMDVFRTEAAAGEARFMKLFEQQTRRLTFFACVAIGVAAVVAIMGLVALLR